MGSNIEFNIPCRQRNFVDGSAIRSLQQSRPTPGQTQSDTRVKGTLYHILRNLRNQESVVDVVQGTTRQTR